MKDRATPAPILRRRRFNIKNSRNTCLQKLEFQGLGLKTRSILTFLALSHFIHRSLMTVVNRSQTTRKTAYAIRLGVFIIPRDDF